MGEYGVTRWRRYGKDRLYVSDPAGAQIGWVDVADGSEHFARAAAKDTVRAAVVAFCRSHDIVLPLAWSAQGDFAASFPSQASVEPRRRAEAAAPDAIPAPAAWVDLALNVPGQAARERAELELAAAREHSRVGTFLARAFDVKTDERGWRVGADGEETVGVRLEKLRKHGWHVLHAVPVGDRGSDIDHLLIGPGGVWTINTKTHPGGSVWVGRHQVRVNGHRTQYLRNSRFEAERATRLLTAACGYPVFAKAALVFLTGSLIPNVTIKQLPEDVGVLDRMDIPGAFRRTKRKLTDEQVSSIFEQARRSTTWTS